MEKPSDLNSAVILDTVEAASIRSEMKFRFRELFPGAVLENLERLEAEALEARSQMLAPGDSWGACGEHREYELIKKLSDRITERGCFIRPERATRVLLTNVPEVIGPETLAAARGQGLAEKWASCVLLNIEHEFDIINRDRMLFMTIVSTAVGVLALLLSVFGIALTIYGLIYHQA